MRVELVAHRAAWAETFADVARAIREVLGEPGVAVHHIGSTSVPGLAAKPIVDVQVGVGSAAALDPTAAALDGVAGLERLPGNPDGRKRYLRRREDPRGDVNCHVRVAGEFSAQAALLLRDHLRADPAARRAYETTKRRLASQEWPSIDEYADAKGDTVWRLLRAADRWAWDVAWTPPASDG